MARYASTRVLLAPRADVWKFLADPYRLADWFPGVAGVEPDRRGLAPGARWRIVGPGRPSYLRKPDATGVLLVLDVARYERISFQLTGERVEATIALRAVAENRTEVTLEVEAPFLGGVRRSFPARALTRLHALVQTGAEEE